MALVVGGEEGEGEDVDGGRPTVPEVMDDEDMSGGELLRVAEGASEGVVKRLEGAGVGLGGKLVLGVKDANVARMLDERVGVVSAADEARLVVSMPSNWGVVLVGSVGSCAEAEDEFWAQTDRATSRHRINVRRGIMYDQVEWEYGCTARLYSSQFLVSVALCRGSTREVTIGDHRNAALSLPAPWRLSEGQGL